MRYLAALLFSLMLANSETVDRLAVTVGSTVITELQIDEELRVAALLSGQPLLRDTEARRGAADRLVAQLLIQHEIELSHYPPPSEQDVATLFSAIQTTMGGAEAAGQLLKKYRVSEQTLRAHLMAQLATLRFIEVRFTPDVSISDSEIEAAYRRKLSASRIENPDTKVPALDASERAKLSEVLLAERTDAALNSWLAESRKQVNIVYIDLALQ